MRNVKEVWINPSHESNELFTLSIESSNPEVPVTANETRFPEKPTKKHPLRYTTVIGLLSIYDIIKIRNALQSIIDQRAVSL